MTVIPKGSRVALLDEPVHRNIGDHLIHLGIEHFFLDNDITIVARAHTFSYHRRWLSRRIDNDTIIACNGGGHLGDLYPGHQRLREQVVTDFPTHRIVVLPQSMYFRTAKAMQQAAAVFRGHTDFHLFLRDRDSRQRAKTMGLHNLYLAPDMAHALYPLDLDHHARPHGEALYLLRRDLENTAVIPAAEAADAATDWPDIVCLRNTLTLAAVAAAFRLLRPVGPPKSLNALLDWEHAALVGRGVELLAAYDQIVTSRLHGALLGLLLGKRVRLLASLTGKSHAYYETWLAENKDCKYVSKNMG